MTLFRIWDGLKQKDCDKMLEAYLDWENEIYDERSMFLDDYMIGKETTEGE